MNKKIIRETNSGKKDQKNNNPDLLFPPWKMLLYSRNSARVMKFSGRIGWNSREGKERVGIWGNKVRQKQNL